MSYLNDEQKYKILGMLLTRESGVELIEYLEKMEKHSYGDTPDSKQSTLRSILSNLSIKKGHPIYYLFNDIVGFDLDKDLEPDSLRALVLEIGDLVKDAELIRITLGFSPDDVFTHKLYEWFKSEIQTPFVLDIDVNKEMLGGIQFVYRGKFHDLSLEKKLDGVLAKLNNS